MAERYAKYFCTVYAQNRHPSYGKPVEVFATTPQGAVNRAVDIGWNGRDSDARVRIDRVEDLDPRENLNPEPAEKTGGES